MFRRIISCVVLISFVMMLFISCTGDSVVSTNSKNESMILQAEMSCGELHNKFVRMFLKVRPERCTTRLDEDQNYLDTYIESSREACKSMGIDIELDRDVLDQFLQLNNSMKNAGIWDAFNPTAYSPPEVINHLRDTGAISAKDARLIQNMLKRVKNISPHNFKKDSSNDSKSFLTAEEVKEASPLVLEVEEILVNSIALWKKILDTSGEELVKIDPSNPEVVADWWKVLIKLVATAVSDTIVFVVTTYLTWNPTVVVFFTSISSLAAYEAFDERDW